MPYSPLHPLAGISWDLGHDDPCLAMDNHLNYELEDEDDEGTGLWRTMNGWQEIIDDEYNLYIDRLSAVNSDARSTETGLNDAAVSKAAQLLSSGDVQSARTVLAIADGRALERAAGRVFNVIVDVQRELSNASH